MALTAAETFDLRRYCGYPGSNALTIQTLEVQGNSAALDSVIAALSPEQESVVRNIYITNLRLLESALVGAGIGDSDSLDTKKAAVWERNPNELAERVALFTAWRLRLCEDLGIPSGPGIITPLLGVGAGSSTALPPAVLVV